MLEPHCPDFPLSPSNSDDIREALQYAVDYASSMVRIRFYGGSVRRKAVLEMVHK